jgi:predicted enzyme related to lactoylglutathione lyase
MARSLCVWFEIPVKDIGRARKFYSEVTGIEVSDPAPMGDSTMAFFPMSDDWENSGALTQGPQSVPCDNGVTIYLNGGDDLSVMLDRVEPAGGEIIFPKTQISEENGYFAIFGDTEGNAVGLWSMK